MNIKIRYNKRATVLDISTEVLLHVKH